MKSNYTGILDINDRRQIQGIAEILNIVYEKNHLFHNHSDEVLNKIIDNIYIFKDKYENITTQEEKTLTHYNNQITNDVIKSYYSNENKLELFKDDSELQQKFIKEEQQFSELNFQRVLENYKLVKSNFFNKSREAINVYKGKWNLESNYLPPFLKATLGEIYVLVEFIRMISFNGTYMYFFDLMFKIYGENGQNLIKSEKEIGYDLVKKHKLKERDFLNIDEEEENEKFKDLNINELESNIYHNTTSGDFKDDSYILFKKHPLKKIAFTELNAESSDRFVLNNYDSMLIEINVLEYLRIKG